MPANVLADIERMKNLAKSKEDPKIQPQKDIKINSEYHPCPKFL